MSPLKSFALLTLPLWGTVVLLGLLSLIPGASRTSGDSILFLGVLLVLGGAVPIFTAKDMGVGSKTLLFALYVIVSAVVMFVVGWGALAVFGLAK